MGPSNLDASDSSAEIVDIERFDEENEFVSDVSDSFAEIVGIERDEENDFATVHDPTDAKAKKQKVKILKMPVAGSSFEVEGARKTRKRQKKHTKPKKGPLFEVVLTWLAGIWVVGVLIAFTCWGYTGQGLSFKAPVEHGPTMAQIADISHIMPTTPPVAVDVRSGTPNRFTRYSPQVQLIIRDLLNSSSTESDDDVASSWDQWMLHRQPPPTWVSREVPPAIRIVRGQLGDAPMMPPTIRVRIAPLIPRMVARLQVLDQRDDKLATLQNVFASDFNLRQFPSTDSETVGEPESWFAPSSGYDLAPINVAEAASATDTLKSSLPTATSEMMDTSVTDAVIDCIHSRWGSSESVDAEIV